VPARLKASAAIIIASKVVRRLGLGPSTDRSRASRS